jgi:catechol 2,3-dioxygenase-like lactoylglutathione lyase family enzyme
MPEPQRPFTITRADHTGITVSSIPDALHFWVDVLGFRVISQVRLGGSLLANVVGVERADASLALLEAPGHRIELLEYHAPADRQTIQPRSCDVGSVHVAFMVENLDALLQRIQQAGWHALGEVQTIEGGPRDGTRLMYVRAPDGVTVEFLEAPGRRGAPA